MLFLLRFIPQNHLSYLVGVLLAIRLPKIISQFLILQFAQFYKINLQEAEKPYSEYESIADFFVRKLKAGARPLGNAEVLHPADALITQIGKIENGKLIQAKGKLYSLKDLLREDLLAEYADGIFVTYYLCPTDYHRVHAPVAGEIIESVHIPGSLWPVNQESVQGIADLFTINERVITKMRTPNRGLVSLVFVGATNVGKIELSYDSQISSNDLVHKTMYKRDYTPPIAMQKGDELGMFRMGSTVVMLYPKAYAAIFTEELCRQLQNKQVQVRANVPQSTG